MQQAARAIIPTQADGILFSCDSSLLAVWHSETAVIYSVLSLVEQGHVEALFAWTVKDNLAISQIQPALGCLGWNLYDRFEVTYAPVCILLLSVLFSGSRPLLQLRYMKCSYCMLFALTCQSSAYSIAEAAVTVVAGP